MSRRRWALGLAGGALIAVAGVAAAYSADITDRAVQDAALRAVTGEYGALRASGTGPTTDMFAGRALDQQLGVREHVRALMTAGTDYPGDIELSDIKIEHVQVSDGVAAVDFQAHARLPNMRAGAVVDYSESDMIYHLELVLQDGDWKISDMEAVFAPGGGP